MEGEAEIGMVAYEIRWLKDSQEYLLREVGSGRAGELRLDEDEAARAASLGREGLSSLRGVPEALLRASSSCFLTAAALSSCRLQARRRELGRAATAWMRLKERKRGKRSVRTRFPSSSPSEADRLAYLLENRDALMRKLASRGALDEFMALCRDLKMGRREAKEAWGLARKAGGNV